MRCWQLLGMVVVLPMTLSSCAVNKVIECNRVIAIANQVNTDTYTLTEENNSEDPLIWLEASDALDTAAQQMQTLEVQDDQLKGYQGGFAKMYGAIAGATRAFAKSVQDQDREGVDAARAQLEQAVKPEPDLVQGINTYCMAS